MANQTSDATEELNRLMNKESDKSRTVDGGVWMPDAAQDCRISDLEKRVAELEKKL